MHADKKGVIMHAYIESNQLFQPRVVTLVADKLETVVRRRDSESNCIRELERMMVQPQLCDQKKKGFGD